MAAARIKSAGNSYLPLTLEITIFLLSKGSLKISMAYLGNSGSSSKNRTPPLASDNSPGTGYFPPPANAWMLLEWWGLRNGRFRIRGCSLESIPHTL